MIVIRVGSLVEGFLVIQSLIQGVSNVSFSIYCVLKQNIFSLIQFAEKLSVKSEWATGKPNSFEVIDLPDLWFNL